MELSKTILIVDDDLDFQMMVSGVLNRSGYKVKSILEGRIKSVLKVAKECDMILLDLSLPGMNGVEVGKKLKANPSTESIPIILISGDSEVDRSCQACHANGFILKPFSLSGLLLKIKELTFVTS
jgi:twitching motility two-component system response regulator PilH